ncbi:hypothetical protein PWT90_05385 [Aphanocladium album]|nr:hypothetical protein PWT90_05385 [Aphanocladium album]
MYFEELGVTEAVAKAARSSGLDRPLHLQFRAIPAIFTEPRRDIILEAPSKTGRTTALVLGMLQRIDSKKSVVQAIVVVPHREQVIDTLRLARKLGDPLHVKCHGFALTLPFDTDLDGDADVLCSGGAQVVIATPRWVTATINSGALDLGQVIMAIIDDADETSSRGHDKQMVAILSRLRNPLVQLILVSATWPPQLRQLAKRGLRDPLYIQDDRRPSIGQEGNSPGSI